MTAPNALSPLHAAHHIVEGVTEYLTTSFSLTGGNAREELGAFLTDADKGMFHGPYVRTRLPYQQASGWEGLLDWLPENFVPYQHQAEAFARLYPRQEGARPQPTMVVTGTGSGKTEAFLLPILNHARRTRAAGRRGIKALILYPMNALANDQASRLAELLSTEPELASVTAGIYTGEYFGSENKQVTENLLITDRYTMRQDPPDILLTNYKMLDQLLLRDADQLMWELSADSLQYIVLDEFHTYDGAQGTDVALLLRRLGLRLKDFGGNGFDQRPLGNITPVATSATLGSEGDPAVMLDFAETIFGEAFAPEAVITETQVDIPTWQANMAKQYGSAADPGRAQDGPAASDGAHSPQWTADLGADVVRDVLDTIEEQEEATGYVDAARQAIATHLLGTSTELDEILAAYPQHPFFHGVLAASQQARPLGENGRTIATGPRITSLTQQVLGQGLIRVLKTTKAEEFMAAVLTFMADTRARAGEVNSWQAKAIPGVEAHLWIREVSRIERAVNPQGGAAYKWGDDGRGLNAQGNLDGALEAEGQGHTHWLPACYCRNCGRSGWMVTQEPNSEALLLDAQRVRTNSMEDKSRQRPVLDATAELTEARQRGMALTDLGPHEGDSALRWLDVTMERFVDNTPDEKDQAEGLAIPVLTYSPNADASVAENQTCPACGEFDAIRYVGSAVATLLSVALSNLYGMPDLSAEEKKTLIFTDSVQDAAHRAGFVQARARTFTVRAAIANAVSELEDGAGAHSTGVPLPEIVSQLQADAKDSPRKRFELLPPAIAHYQNFSGYWRPEASRHEKLEAQGRVADRLQMDVDLEFGDRADLPRSLMLTGALSCMVDVSGEILLDAAREAVDTEMLDFDNLRTSEDLLVTWARGVVETIRFSGGISHRLTRNYLINDASPWHLNNRRMQERGMPTFAPFNTPQFPRTGKPLKKADHTGSIIADAARGRFAAWTHRVLGHSTHDAAHAVAKLLAALAARGVLQPTDTRSGGRMYALPEDSVVVTREEEPKVLECDTCRAKTGVAARGRAHLVEAPCFVTSCSGNLKEVAVEDNYYRSLYSTTEPRSVVAGEHTGLIDPKERQALEQAFRADTSSAPDAPNVLVATPTLEMGIDIGSLSTVMLSSMPNTVASYVQRVGRAGRRSGNSLIIALIQGRGKALPKLNNPLSVISGSVQPPAAFLRATEILQRQLFARILDTMELGSVRTIADIFDTRASGPSVVDRVHELIDTQPDRLAEVVDTFIDTLGRFTDDKTKTALRSWATDSAGLATQLRLVAERRRADLDTLGDRKKRLDENRERLEALQTAGQIDEVGENELKEVERSVRFIAKEIDDLFDEKWIAALERLGLLPNFTLLDDVVDLKVGLRSRNITTGEYEFDTREYQRGLASALYELAPGNSFYVQGTRADIDAVDLGRDRGDLQEWRVCPSCSYMETVASDRTTGAGCPECGEAAFYGTEQVLDVLPLRRVSSEVTQGEAGISDRTEDRVSRHYTMAEGCTIPEGGRDKTWFTKNLGFGAAVLSDVELRWLNLGSRSHASGGLGGSSEPKIIGGREHNAPLFTVCEYCGRVPAHGNTDKRYGHRPWCIHRTSGEDHNTSFVLGRTLRTQGVLLYLPRFMTAADSLAVPSLTAAIMLGFKQVLGGDPQHLGVSIVQVAAKEGAPPSAALLLHDRVPGGTGYLTQFSSAEDVRSLLAAAYQVVTTCHCAEDGRQACPDCLLPYAHPQQIDKVVRATAAHHLGQLLADDSEARDGALSLAELESCQWETTQEQPEMDPQSELELRFNLAIRAELEARHFTLRETTKSGRTELQLRAPGAQAWWRMEQEKVLDGTRPDFYFTYDDSNVRPIAVYVDGAQFHVSSHNFRVDDDFAKRNRLIKNGMQVWSLTWDDLERYDADAGPVRELYDGANPRTKSEIETKYEQRDILKKDALRQLTDFLHEPKPGLWAGLADFALRQQITGAPRASLKPTNSGKGIEFTLEDQLHVVWEPSRSHMLELITTDAEQPVEPMDEGSRRQVWNLFLTLSNLLWAAGGKHEANTSKNKQAEDFRFVESMLGDLGTSGEAATPEGEAGAASVAGGAAGVSSVDLAQPEGTTVEGELGGWQEAYEEFDGEDDALEALERLRALNFPAPTTFGEESPEGYSQIVAYDPAGAPGGQAAGQAYELIFDELEGGFGGAEDGASGVDLVSGSSHTITLEMLLAPKSIEPLVGLPVGKIIERLQRGALGDPEDPSVENNDGAARPGGED